MKYTNTDNRIEFSEIDSIDLARSCFCGQAFRWKELGGGVFGCVIGNDFIKAHAGDGSLTVETSGMTSPEAIARYFDLRRDYSALETRMADDPVLKATLPYATGIRVFSQEPFETLISFIISANNNIKRITKIIDSLCRKAGEKIILDGEVYYAFPTPESIAALTLEELYGLGLGYRAPYLKNTALAICAGFPLEGLRDMSYRESRRELCKLSGVGPKVADCVLLFSLGHTSAFPMDVWMKRAMREMFFGGIEPEKEELESVIGAWGEDAGIIQQYIFHFARETTLGV